MLPNSSQTKNKKKSLDECVNQLTAAVENTKMRLDGFVAVYESEKFNILSQEEEKKINDVVSKDFEKEKIQKAIIDMEKKVERQILIHVRDKMNWEKEREKLLEELEYYRSLIEKNQTDNSSTQITLSTEEAKDIVESQSVVDDPSKLYKCRNCNNFTTNSWHIFNCHQTIHGRRISKFGCKICKIQFLQKTNFERHNTSMHGFNETEMRTIEAARAFKKRRYLLIEECKHMCTMYPKLEEKDKQERVPKVEEALVAQITSTHVEENTNTMKDTVQTPENHAFLLINSLPVAASAALQSKVQLTVPVNEPIDDKLRRNLRQRFVLKLLRHSCNSKCFILMLKDYMEHASVCTDGPECSWYICKRIHVKTEHLKVCKDKVECSFCRPYINFNEVKMQSLITALEKGCRSNPVGPYHMSASFKKAMVNMFARLAVNYGLIGDCEKIDKDDTETPELKNSNDSASSSDSSSSDSENSSSSDKKEPSSDEEEPSSGEEEPSSEEEKTSSEEWELVELEN